MLYFAGLTIQYIVQFSRKFLIFFPVALVHSSYKIKTWNVAKNYICMTIPSPKDT